MLPADPIKEKQAHMDSPTHFDQQATAGQNEPVGPPKLAGFVHEVKVWPEFYRALESGEKTFELRKDDRGYHVGHVLRLLEWYPGSRLYSGRRMDRTITYVLSGFGVERGYVVLGLSPAAREAGCSEAVPTRADGEIKITSSEAEIASLRQQLRDVDDALDGQFASTQPCVARAVQQQREALDRYRDRAEAAEARLRALKDLVEKWRNGTASKVGETPLITEADRCIAAMCADEVAALVGIDALQRKGAG
jgi:hypothetical protein